MEYEEAFDNLKTKALKYVLFKKRSKAEIRQKFAGYDEKMLDEVIEFLEDNNYINDNSYIEKTVNEFMRLKNMSIKEIEYKLMSKGLSRDQIERYIDDNIEKLLEYELCSAKSILIKKQTSMDIDEIIMYLRKKGYSEDTISECKM